MNIKKIYNKNNKLVKFISLLLFLSIFNTVEGYVYCVYGFGYEFLITELVSIVFTLLLLSSVWKFFNKK
jgi:hypothetical protein